LKVCRTAERPPFPISTRTVEENAMRLKSIRAVPTAALHLISLRGAGSNDHADDYRPIRPNPGFTEDGLDFGSLVGVATMNGVTVLRVDRSRFYTDGEVVDGMCGGRRLDAAEGVATYVLDPKASLQGEKALRNQRDAKPARKTLTRAEFVRSLERLESEGLGTLVWLRHGGRHGQVTALAEQHVPRRR